MSNKFSKWLQSDKFFTGDLTAFKTGAKKVLPWIVGGAAAICGVMLGYKMMNSEPSCCEYEEEEPTNDSNM